MSKILVLSDAYDTGWKVYIDSRESTILQADFALRGVSVPPGRYYRICISSKRIYLGYIRFNCRTLILGFGMYLFRKVKMKIGIYSPYLDTLGGGERYMISLAFIGLSHMRYLSIGTQKHHI